jgi:hypothetical protein
MPDQPLEEPEYAAEPNEETFLTQEDYFASNVFEASAQEIGLTDEDITYLRLKWGKAYKPEEWV